MKNKGFTLVELLMATAFFSFVLIFAAVGFIQINRLYTKGVTVRRVQNSARLIVEDITRSLRTADQVNASGSIAPVSGYSSAPPSVYRLCLGDLRYAWNQNTDPTSSTFSNEKLSGNIDFNFVKDYDSAACGSQLSSDTTTSLLDENVRVQYLDISNIGPRSWRISLTVSSANAEDLSVFGKDAACKTTSGQQFCDVAKLQTVVSLRN